MKRIIILLTLMLSTIAFATQARVEAMGKRSAFFVDDSYIFINPANATFYPNALMGELGFYNQDYQGETDPITPWFGALFKYGLSTEGLRDPQITIGGFFGRDNYDFLRFVPEMVEVKGEKHIIPRNVTNFDAFLAGTMPDGSAIGAHVYVAVQDGKLDDPDNSDPAVGVLEGNAHVSILSMDYGANFLVSNSTSMEVSLGVARIQYGPSRKTFLDPGLFSFYSQGRLFIELESLNSQLVTGYKWADMSVPGWEEDQYGLNIGFNKIIPRGMWWLGLDGVLVQETIKSWDRLNGDLYYREPLNKKEEKDLPEDWSDKIGGAISFGIERNAFKDWLILRAGGQKSVAFQKCRSKSGNSTICPAPAGSNGEKVAMKSDAGFWTTNPLSNGSLDDHLGIGIGINVENKLKIDATIAEDALMRNPFLGPGRIISRIAAIYTF